MRAPLVDLEPLREAGGDPELTLVKYSTLQKVTLCTLRLDKVVAPMEELVHLVR